MLNAAAKRKWDNAAVGVVRLSTMAPSAIPVMLPSPVPYSNNQVTISAPAPVLSPSESLTFGYPGYAAIPAATNLYWCRIH